MTVAVASLEQLPVLSPPTNPTTPRQLREYQIEAADAVNAAHSRGVVGPAVVLPTGTGKAQPLDTVIPTPDGFRRFGDLCAGDAVFGSDGHPTSVVAVHDVGTATVMRLGFDDGASTRVATDHLWQATDAATGAEDVYRTIDIAANLHLPGGAPRWTIPVTAAVQFPGSGRLPVDPYTFGSELRAGLDDGGLIERYLTAGVEDRREMLAGVLGDRYRIAASSPSIALAAAGSLIRSLGGLPTWVRHGNGYSLQPLWTETGGLRREIVSVDQEPDQQCRCITVAAADGLYLTGGDFVLTHNSTVIAELARREVALGGRVLLMAHRDELIKQMAVAVMAVNPAGPVPSLISGGHRDDPAAQIISATVQSLQTESSLAKIGHRDLVIVDEAHHAPARTYRKVLEHFEAIGGRRAGFTATMIRHAPAKGEPPLRTIWQEVVFERDITWAIANGFLIAPEGVTVELPELDVSALASGSGGDISDEVAEEAMMRETTLNATVDAVLTRTEGRSSIVFGASLMHCEQLAKSLVEQGVSAEVVVGETKTRVRNGIYSRFRQGTTRVLVTVDVLTEGADFPRCEAVVLARPTRSQTRLVQCVGRALRPHTFEDGTVKDTALVVDLVGAGSLGLIVKTRLDPEHRQKSDSDENTGLGCGCTQPCVGYECDFSCTGTGCECGCSCADESDGDTGPAALLVSSVPCTCSCALTFGLCRCGCECDLHRVDPLQTFDPITGEVVSSGQQRRGDATWSTRTDSIRWTRHPRGMVRPIYRQTGSKGVLMLADMRGVAGTVPGHDWAFGFYDTSVRRMFWVATTGTWTEPGPQCFLRGLSLADADELAQNIFGGHMRDANRERASDAQISLAQAAGVPDADQLDRRDLTDMIALAQADYWLPQFQQSETDAETAA